MVALESSSKQLAFRIENTNIKTVNFEHACVLDPNNGVHYVVVYRPWPTTENDLK